MKILFTTHQFLPDYSSGTEILTLNTAEEMRRRGHTVYVFTGYPLKRPGPGVKPFDSYEFHGVPVERFFYCKKVALWTDNPMESEYHNAFFAERFRGRLQQIRPDVVHCYHLQGLSASVIDVCKRLEIPTLFTTTDFWSICPTNQLLMPDLSLCLGPEKKSINCLRHLVALSQGNKMGSMLGILPDRLLSILMRCARCKIWPDKKFGPLIRALINRPQYLRTSLNRLDRVLVPTRFMKDMLIRFGIEPEWITQLGFGIDDTYISSVLPKGDGANLRLGFIGTLYHHKGAHVLLEAVRLLPRDLALSVKIYGSLEQFPEYVKTLRSLSLNDKRVEFSGTFHYSKIGEVLGDLDVLIVPSLWYENAPLVVYTALGAKVPVVATDSGGVNEIIIPYENGLLFERGDAKGLSALIQMLCDDRGLVTRLSDNARKPKSISAYVNELEQIYLDLGGWVRLEGA